MEISQYLDFDFLIRFLEGLQKFLGENSEILIHDYRKGYDHTIVKPGSQWPCGWRFTEGRNDHAARKRYRADERQHSDLLQWTERPFL